MVHIIQGSLLDTPHLYIAHGVNCQNVMGAGVAKAIYKKYPNVKQAYHFYSSRNTPEELLGTIHPIDTEDHIIINCYTQLDYGKKNTLYFSYDAFKRCLQNIHYLGVRKLAMPKIGCGLAGGDWNIVLTILNEFYDMDFYVYVIDK